MKAIYITVGLPDGWRLVQFAVPTPFNRVAVAREIRLQKVLSAATTYSSPEAKLTDILSKTASKLRGSYKILPVTHVVDIDDGEGKAVAW